SEEYKPCLNFIARLLYPKRLDSFSNSKTYIIDKYKRQFVSTIDDQHYEDRNG
ncbi:unnamed protein product, partial [marine sediment metagenome]